MKEILNKKETMENIVAGINDLASIVSVTLGGKGKNVILNVGGGVQIINDGVSIAREVSFDHKPAKNTGALLAKKVAEKTNDEAGDGTTTAIVLLQAYVQGLLKTETTDPRQFRDDVKAVLDDVLARLDKMKIEVTTDEEIERVAFISSLDKEISKNIAEVIKVTGKDGVISIDTGKRPGIEYEIVEGVRVSEGLLIPHLINKNDRQVGELENTPVLLSKKPINALADINGLLQEVVAKGFNSLAIITEEISDEVLGFLVVNKTAGIFNPIVVKTHDMDDIEVVTGAKIISPENNLKFEMGNLGMAKKVTAGKNHTTIIGSVSKEAVDAKIADLRKIESNTEDEYDKTKVTRRIARLQGGIAIMRVAGENDEETKEKRLKLEDALNAAKAAMEGGIIPGGGLALWRIGEEMKKSEIDGEAVALMIQIIQKPMEQILINAEEDVEAIKKRLEGFWEIGYNVVTRKTENFFESGVIDPVKVTKSALQNAVHMGNMIATAEGAVIFTMEKPHEK